MDKKVFKVFASCVAFVSAFEACSSERLEFHPAEVHEESMYVAKQGNSIECGYGDYVQVFKGTRLVGSEYRLSEGRYIVVDEYSYSSDGTSVSATVSTQGEVGYLSQIRLDSLGLPVSAIINDIANGRTRTVNISYLWNSNGDLASIRIDRSLDGKEVHFIYKYESDEQADDRLRPAFFCPVLLDKYLPGGSASLICNVVGKRAWHQPSLCRIDVYTNESRSAEEVWYEVSDTGRQLYQKVFCVDFIDPYRDSWSAKNITGYIDYAVE